MDIFSVASGLSCCCMFPMTFIIPPLLPFGIVFLICGLILIVAGAIQLAVNSGEEEKFIDSNQIKKMTTLYKKRNETSTHYRSRD